MSAKTAKLTEWYSDGQKPKRKGVYRTRTAGKKSGEVYQHWSGKWWGSCGATVDDAHYGSDRKSVFQNNEWRGLASDPKAGKA